MPGKMVRSHGLRRWEHNLTVALVMPVHPPKFALAVRFARSLVLCQQIPLHAYYPVTMGNTSDKRDLLLRMSGTEHSIAKVIEVFLPENHWCANRTPQAGEKGACLTTWKKLYGVRYVFTFGEHSLALAIDADSEFQTPASYEDWYRAWPQRRVVVGWNFTSQPTRSHLHPGDSTLPVPGPRLTTPRVRCSTPATQNRTFLVRHSYR